jgi:hypothetical protein
MYSLMNGDFLGAIGHKRMRLQQCMKEQDLD